MCRPPIRFHFFHFRNNCSLPGMQFRNEVNGARVGQRQERKYCSRCSVNRGESNRFAWPVRKNVGRSGKNRAAAPGPPCSKGAPLPGFPPRLCPLRSRDKGLLRYRGERDCERISAPPPGVRCRAPSLTAHARARISVSFGSLSVNKTSRPCFTTDRRACSPFLYGSIVHGTRTLTDSGCTPVPAGRRGIS